MKRFISGFIVLAMLLSCMGMVPVSAEAEYTEVGTVEEFIEVLESNGDRNIIVTRDIIYTCQVSDVGEYWITLGSGKKTLNLNGKSVELNAETGIETTMIRVPKGADLTINDTSGDNSGKLFCYGKMTSPRDEDGVIRYLNDAVKYRNVLQIDGGVVTINGGTLEAGRSKKMWIYDGRDVYDLRHLLDYTIQFGVLGLAIGARFDGYAWQQVNGDCITINDGSLMVNDGVFLGRGFSHLETFVKENDNDVDVEYSRSACLRLLGGTTIINDGTFWGKGNADVLSAKKEVAVKVKNGTFSTNHLRVLSVPTINVTLYGYWEPYVIGHAQRYGYQYHPASEVGNVRLTSDMLDPQRNAAELNGETVPVSEWAKLNSTSNEGSATVVITHHMSNSDRRNFMSGRDSRKEISKLNIEGTNAYGMALTPDVLSCDEDGVKKISVEWYHNDEPVGDEEYMVAGKYQAKVTVSLDANYAFSGSPKFTIMGDRVSDYEISSLKRIAVLWSKVYDLECNHSYNEDEYLRFDSDKHFLKCSVCDKILLDEEHYFDDGESDGNAIIYKCRGCDFSYGEVDDGKVRIDYININIPNPKTGYFPEYYGLISGEGVSFADGGDEFTKNGIRWGLYANDFGVAEDVPFASGMGYRATLYLRADEGYTFSRDQNAQYNPVVIVNGEEAKFETDGELMTVTYEVNTPEVKVSYIDMSGIDFPEIGKNPDCKPESAAPQYYDVKSDSGAVSWYEDGKYMDKTDTFKAGKEYTVEMYVDTIRSGWDYTAKFAENLTSVSVDGFAVNGEGVNRLNDTTVVVSYTFPVLEEEKEEEPEKPAEPEKPTEPEKPAEPEKPTEPEKPQKPEKPEEIEKPQGTEKTTFVDVTESEYYYAPVMWAVEEGITSGTGANTFSPDENCSRAQVVTFLHRMVGSPEPAAIDNPFTDVRSDYYYYKPVMWAYGSKITGGTSASKFSPDDNCTRGQVVTFLWRTAGQPKAEGAKNPFKDVKADSYYYDAVLWAVENGITGGTGADTFSPDENCTRAQVVTFLYRFLNN